MHDANDIESPDDGFYSGEAEYTPLEYFCSDYYNYDDEDDADDDEDANFDFVEDDADDSADIISRRLEVNSILHLNFLLLKLELAK